MSSTYRPGNPPSDPRALSAFLAREFASLANALERAQPDLIWEYRHAEPEKIVPGMVVLADGTDWNPSAGVGLYRRSEDNTAWEYMEAASAALALAAHIADTTDAHDASAISNVPAGGIAATNVQTALNELDADKEATGTAAAAVAAHVALADPHTQYLTAAEGNALYPSGSGTSTGTNTGDQTSIVGITGTLAQFNTALTGADFATGGGTVTGTSSGTNTGDQTSIVGITGTIAQFNAACTDADFQPLDADLTSWAGVTRAAGFDTFAATPTNANLATLLTDDVGTWTPVLTFATPGTLAVAYSVQIGTWSRQGNTVTADFQIVTSTFTLGTASGNLQITGLLGAGFTASSANDFTGSLIWGGITKAGYTQIAGRLFASQSSISLQASGSGVVPSQVTATDTPTGGTVRLIGQIKFRL